MVTFTNQWWTTSISNTRIGQATPLGRAGQPVECVGPYVLFASEDGSYLTGQVHSVTGGIQID